MKPTLFLLGALFLVSGCNSIEVQHRRFVGAKNSEIGFPFYGNGTTTNEVKLNETESEFIPKSWEADGYAVVWRVDTTERGPYHHPNGMTFHIQGMKKSWRFIGDPNKALMPFRLF
jgi:hypothetical protein